MRVSTFEDRTWPIPSDKQFTRCNLPISDHHVHIVGAGLSGLAASIRCLDKGFRVSLYEATNHAGGRCRSFYDPQLKQIIDNGTHLILGGNPCVFEYLRAVGAVSLLKPAPGALPFIDLASGEKWSLRPGNTKFPLWLFMPGRRIPGTRLVDYKAIKRLSAAGGEDTLTKFVDVSSVMFERFWDPLCTAVLNTDAKDGSAKLISRMLEMTVLKGPAFARPFLAPAGLSAALIEPGLSYLRKGKINLKFRKRLKSIDLDHNRAGKMIFVDNTIALTQKDHIILCLPPHQIRSLLPIIEVPTDTRPILNVHFGLTEEHPLPEDAPFMGIINGTSQWLFRRANILSVTVSNASVFVEKDTDELVNLIWREISHIISCPKMPLPNHRVVMEKRATISQTPEQNALRPDSVTKWKNLYLAGDWTNTGLPATIESAVQSGQIAAETLSNSLT